MDFAITLIIILSLSLILLYFIDKYILVNNLNNHFTNPESNNTICNYLKTTKKVYSKSALVDPLACYRGTYWRNKSYDNVCLPLTCDKPKRLTTDGKRIRLPEARYEIVCNPDQHLNRNCKMVKVYRKFY